MSKNIIICSDGTGNTTIKNRGTNVFKLFEAVDTYDKGNPQISIYDDGVGSSNSKISKSLGGAFGIGLARNVRQLYTSIVRNYDEGDKIYLFGFSRGAFTVRTLAGFICEMGILRLDVAKNDSELKSIVNHFYRRYRWKKRALFEKIISSPFALFFHFYHKSTQFTVIKKLKDDRLIDFIGVWDTVSAVGVPIRWISKTINHLFYRFSFKDNKLGKEVTTACQALSIDEQRKTFYPEIWHEKGEEKGRIEQVWFAGVHSNVGGGYPKQGMSLVALDWMMRKAKNRGISFIDHDMDIYNKRQNVNDKLYNSRKGISVLYRFDPRNIQKLCAKYSVEPLIHSSAINRIHKGTDGYAPGNLPGSFEIVDKNNIPCTWQNVNEEMINTLGEGRTLLTREKGWIALRKFSHSILLLSIIYAVLDFLKDKNIFGLNWSTIALDFIVHLFTNGGFFGVSYALLAGAISYLLMWFAKKVMENKYSAFWFELRKINKES